ncbi:UNVERIFIED_CONTAM: hypothetical protein GTU68_063532 [Idotea baltica]|nr:hypothetical protein [Idotea baltica]
MAFDTYTYSPISEFILKELKLNHGPVTQSEDSLMWRYVAAARQGLSARSAEECGRIHRKCRQPTHKIFNMPVIKVWQFVASKINLGII